MKIQLHSWVQILRKSAYIVVHQMEIPIDLHFVCKNFHKIISLFKYLPIAQLDMKTLVTYQVKIPFRLISSTVPGLSTSPPLFRFELICCTFGSQTLKSSGDIVIDFKFFQRFVGSSFHFTHG